jgi:hypothetical protein
MNKFHSIQNALLHLPVANFPRLGSNIAASSSIWVVGGEEQSLYGI